MQFSENSRVWVYQADRELTGAEIQHLQQQLNNFATAWTAHNQQLKAGAEIRYGRFIILIVDETQAGATGCSIDKSVHFIKQLEQQYHITLLDRFVIAYQSNGQLVSTNRSGFEQRVKAGQVNADTIVYNNMVQTLHELQTRWEVPFKNSWHMQLFGALLPANS